MINQVPYLLAKQRSSEAGEFALSNGSIVSAFTLTHVDAETVDFASLENALRDFLKALPQQIQTRFILRSGPKFQPDFPHSRAEAIETLGSIENELCVVFERVPGPLEQIKSMVEEYRSRARERTTNSVSQSVFQDQLSTLAGLGLRALPMTLSAFEKLLPNSKTNINTNSVGVELGFSTIGVVRLVKQGVHPISPLTLAVVKDQLPLPYSISVLVQTSSQQSSESLLRRKSSQAEVGNDKIAINKYLKAQDDLTKIALSGGRIFRFEFIVTFERSSEEALRNDAAKIVRALRPLGEVYFETFGAKSSWLATLPGNRPHVPILETDDAISCFLPILTRGEPTMPDVSCRALALHRLDESLSFVDVFDPRNDSYSMNIFGPPGSGKSVLCNMLTRALASDPAIRIVKLDVGGSHSRETTMLGGIEHTISLDSPAGIDPFSYLKTIPETPEVLQILSSFVSTLIREEDESTLSKALKSELESAISAYFLRRSESPSLNEFYLLCRDEIPREKLLSRWCKGGVFGNAFRERTEDAHSSNANRLKYYNFAKVSQALDGDFAQGGLAAVMSAFNLDMLFNREGNRFVFIADEVPVFIQRAFDFFSLSIANIRKNGDAFITIAQRSEHVVVHGNQSILDNSPSKFFFAIDGNRDAFAKRLNLSEDSLLKIESLRREQGRFAEVCHVDPLGARIYSVRLSPLEYWSYTSKREDKDKISEIQKAIPKLTIEEAMKCLSLVN